MSITEGQLLGLALRHKEDLLQEESQMISDMADEICELRERVEQLEKPVTVAEDDDGGEELERVIRTLKKEYARAKTIAYVTNPIAWALYHTWRSEDNRNDGRRKKKND